MTSNYKLSLFGPKALKPDMKKYDLAVLMVRVVMVETKLRLPVVMTKCMVTIGGGRWDWSAGRIAGHDNIVQVVLIVRVVMVETKLRLEW